VIDLESLERALSEKPNSLFREPRSSDAVADMGEAARQGKGFDPWARQKIRRAPDGQTASAGALLPT
jgi:hypothetical protein